MKCGFPHLYLVLGRPRGPRTEMRIEAREVAVRVQSAGLVLNPTVELPPYRYGAIFNVGIVDTGACPFFG